MAKLIAGALSSEVRGSLGDINFSRGKGGMYVRTKPTDYPARSARQEETMAYVTTAVGLWQGFTDARRNDWQVFASTHPYINTLGQLQHYSGYTMFLKRWMSLKLNGIDPIEIVPLDSPVQLSTTARISLLHSNAITLRYNETLNSKNAFVFLLSDNKSAGITRLKNQYVRIKTFTEASPGPFAAYSTWNSVYGHDPIEGMRIFLKYYTVNITTGQKSLPVYKSYIVDS